MPSANASSLHDVPLNTAATLASSSPLLTTANRSTLDSGSDNSAAATSRTIKNDAVATDESMITDGGSMEEDATHVDVGIPHAYHYNLPFHHKDEITNIPYVTTFAYHKARKIVELAHSIQLSEALFVEREQVQELDDVDVEDDNSDNDDVMTHLCDVEANDRKEKELDQEVPANNFIEKNLSGRQHQRHQSPLDHEPVTNTLQAVAKKCARLHSQLSTLESLKYSGLSQIEVCEIIIHLLRLVTCTIEYKTPSNSFIDQTMNTDFKLAEKIENNELVSDESLVRLHYENVGYIYTSPLSEYDDLTCQMQQQEQLRQELDAKTPAQQLEDDLQRPFALHSPAREVLLQVLINLISNKGLLRSVSNASIYVSTTPDTHESTDIDTATVNQTNDHNSCPRTLLILHWKALLRTLLRTAPYLDERKEQVTKSDSTSRQNSVIKRTVQLIRDARHFFDQGIRPMPVQGIKDLDPSIQKLLSENLVSDKTARDVWEMVQSDVLYHSHSHACYRGTIILYLFQPSRCSSNFYLDVMPLWLEAWTNIDRCPEYDFLWLAMFCRARKYISPRVYDWGPIRKRLLTNLQYWLQLPIGGEALDKSFPRASNPRSRQCPPRLKAFTGASSSYGEGIDFVAKVVKLLITSIGTGSHVKMENLIHSTSHNETNTISEGTLDILRFLSFVTPYFNPSNLGSWTFTLGAFLHYFAYELCQRIGSAAGIQSLRLSQPLLVDACFKAKPGEVDLEISAHEIVALLDALLPLCQQAIYSKNGHVGRAGEAAMLYLVQIDPVRATPTFIDFAARALDVAAVNQSHQAPAALSALTRLIQPALRTNKSVLLMRLPQLLRLSLAGIDSNDQNKCIRTLIFYRNICSWIPVGGNSKTWSVLDSSDLVVTDNQSSEAVNELDGTIRVGKDLFDIILTKQESPEYLQALQNLPDESLLKQSAQDVSLHESDMDQLILDEAMSAIGDWSLEFLDRIFVILRASGEREKAGKRVSGVANRHSSADVHQARNFSRVLTECMMQLFSSMEDDIHLLCVRALGRFLQEETLPAAAKDASLLCQAASAARLHGLEKNGSVGLDALIPMLTNDLQHCSIKTSIYRLRCCSGAVRSAGIAVVAHRKTISDAINFALASDDRHLFKTGCKLLRHTLSTLSESYPISSSSKPRIFRSDNSFVFGRSAQLHGDNIDWHVPNSDCIDFATDLFNRHVIKSLDFLCEDTSDGDGNYRSRLLSMSDVTELRRCLRIIRYSLRGGASILLDKADDDDLNRNDDFVPYEKAVGRLLDLVNKRTKEALVYIRGRLCLFLTVLSSVIASESLYPDSMNSSITGNGCCKTWQLISSDRKICKETCDIASILLTRRGAAFRSQEARTIWKAQKQVATDFTLCAQADCVTEALQCASCYAKSTTLLYKDGEDSGKAVPRRLLVSRLHLFHNSLQRNASFEVPRRLRRLEQEYKLVRRTLFTAKTSLIEMSANLETILFSKSLRPLDTYEGVIDGLFALCCHSNTQVRASAISIVDYAITRFGWIVVPRVPRLLSGLALDDNGMNGKFGIPDCASLTESINQQGKRRELAESVKGVCSILSRTRAIRQILGSWKLRHQFVKTICGTDRLISLVPAEELQKTVHYLQAVFSPFQSSVYVLSLTSHEDRINYDQCIHFLLDILSEGKAEFDEDLESNEKNASHWRKQLLACWFLIVFIDEKTACGSSNWESIWLTCFQMLESNMGQPLQRVALGLLGKLLSIRKHGLSATLQRHLASTSFCRTLCQALTLDHKEDTSVGGAHDAQWSTGVENIIRDSARHIAPRTLFPFNRTSQSMGSLKIAHCQLIEILLFALDDVESTTVVQEILTCAKELAAAPPSEDQRNQQVTSAEIFGGTCGYFIRSLKMTSEAWADSFLPHLDDVMAKTPYSLCGAYCDAVRYALQFSDSGSFYPLAHWLIEKVETTLWQPEANTREAISKFAETATSNGSPGLEGFTEQSKWLNLISFVIVEMDEIENDGVSITPSWYQKHLESTESFSPDSLVSNSRESSWNLVTKRLLPRLNEALGHPFDSCRDLIARCLFRICYSHRKFKRITASRVSSQSNRDLEFSRFTVIDDDPGVAIVSELASLEKGTKWTNTDRCNALSTARRFMSYCVHLGEAKFEFSDYVIPLLPLSFDTLNLSSDNEKGDDIYGGNKESMAAQRALEAELVKGYRQKLSEISVTAVISYGRPFDITRVIEVVKVACKHETWQVRHAAANFLRCFEGSHKFLFLEEHKCVTTSIVTSLLADGRREVSSAAMAALIGILSALPLGEISKMVHKYIKMSAQSKMKRARKSQATLNLCGEDYDAERARNQQESVFFLSASIMVQPYDTPPYVPQALAAISKHSSERTAPLSVREIVKRCCAEYKRTHMSDNWEIHRAKFSQEQLEALEDVVSSPHYYA